MKTNLEKNKETHVFNIVNIVFGSILIIMFLCVLMFGFKSFETTEPPLPTNVNKLSNMPSTTGIYELNHDGLAYIVVIDNSGVAIIKE
jgi:hypothetical protein